MVHKMKMPTIGPLQLAICVVEGWMDGMGQMDRWEPYSLGKTHTKNTEKQKSYIILNINFFCLSCLSATFVLQHGGFVPRECLATKGLFFKNYFTINRSDYYLTTVK